MIFQKKKDLDDLEKADNERERTSKELCNLFRETTKRIKKISSNVIHEIKEANHG